MIAKYCSTGANVRMWLVKLSIALLFGFINLHPDQAFAQCACKGNSVGSFGCNGTLGFVCSGCDGWVDGPCSDNNTQQALQALDTKVKAEAKAGFDAKAATPGGWGNCTTDDSSVVCRTIKTPSGSGDGASCEDGVSPNSQKKHRLCCDYSYGYICATFPKPTPAPSASPSPSPSPTPTIKNSVGAGDGSESSWRPL